MRKTLTFLFVAIVSLQISSLEAKRSPLLYMNKIIPVQINKNLVLKDLDDGDFKFKDLLGNYVILTLWKKTCGYCHKELPEVDKFMDHFKHDNLKAIAVALPTQYPVPYTEKDIANKVGIYNLKILKSSEVFMKDIEKANGGKINGVPVTFLLNKDLKAIAMFKGYVEFSHEDMAQFIQQMIDGKFKEKKEPSILQRFKNFFKFSK